MINCNNINELQQEILFDRERASFTARRFPVRFVFLKNRSDYKQFKERIINDVNNTIYLESFLPLEDGWFTENSVVDVFKGVNSNSVVLGLSEVLRFFDDGAFRNILEEICGIESSNNKRIYVPMFGLLDRFNNVFWSKFYRKNEWAPIWNVSGENDNIKIFQINFCLKDIKSTWDNYEVFSNSKDWFKIIESDKQYVLSFSTTLTNFFNNFLPDANFNYVSVNNIKEFIKFVLGKNIEIEFNENEKSFWKWVLNIVLSNNFINSIDSLVSYVLNIRDISQTSVYNLLDYFLKERDSFKKWIIKRYIIEKTSFNNYKYLKLVLKDLHKLTNHELIKEIWLKAFHIEDEGEIWQERKKILEFIHNELKEDYTFIEENLKDHVIHFIEKDFFDFKKKITLISDIEKTYYIYKIREIEDYNTLLREIEESYPELYHYLNWDCIKIDNVEDWVINYFKKYNLSKLKDVKLPEIDSLLNEKNANKETFCRWYYNFKRPEVHGEHYVWVDGLGVEWLPLLIYYLWNYGEKQKVFVEKKIICRSLLPTITEINKMENEKKISYLDEYFHKSSSYNYPESLVDEIKIISKIAKKIIDSVNTELVVTSDHGATFLANKRFENNKIYNFENTNHEGRCILDFKNDLNESNYFTWELELQTGKKALIASKHYSLSDLPRREVHGGATPEEVLIPYIKLRKSQVKKEYKVNPLKFEVDIRNPSIKLRIEPIPDTDVYLIISNKRYLLNRRDEFYYTNLEGIRAGEYNCELDFASQKIMIVITIKGGFKEENLL